MSANNEELGWILTRMMRVFERLEKCTPREVLLQRAYSHGQQADPHDSHLRDEQTDKWVTTNTLLSILCFVGYSLVYAALGAMHIPSRIVSASVLLYALPVLLYGAWIIYDIVVIQFNVLVVHPLRTTDGTFSTVSHERSLVLALMNYITIVFWFALVYRTAHFLFAGCSLATPFGALYASLETMSLLGTEALQPTHPLSQCLLLLQMVVGLFMTLVVLSQAVGAIQRGSGG